jgi:Flp pilus assembly protein protease CpaA
MIPETLLNYDFLDVYSVLSVFALLIIASYFDYKTLKIPNKLNLFFLVFRIALIPLIGLKLENLFGLAMGTLLVLIPAMIKMKPMGGDIKIAGVIGFYIGPQNILALMIASILLSAIYYGFIFLRKKELKDSPLAPFILLGFSVLLSIN